MLAVTLVNVPIFLETEWLYVVDKPHGWLTTPARSSDDPRPCLGRRLQTQTGRQIFPVHRLDFEVGGLTLWAKDAESHRLAQRWFENATVVKLYEAYSQAKLKPGDWREWSSKIVRGKRRSFVADHGKPSLTRARPAGEDRGFGKWELQAVTGRPHQLRVEMSRHGFPLLGDVLYGGPATGLKNWIALRAVELNLSAIPEAERLGLPESCRAPGLVLPDDLHLA